MRPLVLPGQQEGNDAHSRINSKELARKADAEACIEDTDGLTLRSRSHSMSSIEVGEVDDGAALQECNPKRAGVWVGIR